MNCAICGRSDADMECKPTVHPVYANEWVHEDCLREEEDAINRDLCREMQNSMLCIKTHSKAWHETKTKGASDDR